MVEAPQLSPQTVLPNNANNPSPNRWGTGDTGVKGPPEPCSKALSVPVTQWWGWFAVFCCSCSVCLQKKRQSQQVPQTDLSLDGDQGGWWHWTALRAFAHLSLVHKSLMPITGLSSTLPCSGAKGDTGPVLRVTNAEEKGHFRRSELIPGVEMSQIQQGI